MKKLIVAASFLSLGIGLLSCGGAHGENPGNAYMPDMYYARAYEAYGYNNVEGEYDSLRSRGIFYNGMTVPGTIARGEMMPSHLSNDSAGLLASQALRNPLDTITNATAMKDAERLYLINCGICHGTALDGNGPLWKNGEGAYPAAPRPLNADYAIKLSDGHYFHVITYGKGAMGSYASQLKPEERWWVIKYIRSKQSGGTIADSSATATAATPATDSAKTKQP